MRSAPCTYLLPAHLSFTSVSQSSLLVKCSAFDCVLILLSSIILADMRVFVKCSGFGASALSPTHPSLLSVYYIVTQASPNVNTHMFYLVDRFPIQPRCYIYHSLYERLFSCLEHMYGTPVFYVKLCCCR